MEEQIRLPEKAERILEVLTAAGHEAFVVGGCVRDALLGRVPEDWDITTSARPEEVKALFRRTVDTGIRHGTVTVLLGQEGYEVTTYRLDGNYSDGRHPDSVTFTPELREDLKRRDFTINAMACGPDGRITDLFGGREDLKARRIRCVGDPEERFSEDALRILRAFRFAAQLDFEITEETRRALRILSPRLSSVSRERVFAELNKMLLSAHPERMAELFQEGIAPQLSENFRDLLAVPALSLLPARKDIRWAAALSRKSGAEIRSLMKEWKSDSKTMEGAALLSEELKQVMPTDLVSLRYLMSRIGAERTEDLLCLRRAGFGAGPDPAGQAAAAAPEIARILQAGDCLSLKELSLGGKDLLSLGIPAGPALGETLSALLKHVLEHPEDNTPERLAFFLRSV